MNLDPKRKILQFLNRAPVFHFRPHPGKGIPPVSLRAPAKPGKPLSTRHWILKNSMENFLSPGLLPYRHSQNPFRRGMSDKLLSLGTCFTKKNVATNFRSPGNGLTGFHKAFIGKMLGKKSSQEMCQMIQSDTQDSFPPKCLKNAGSCLLWLFTPHQKITPKHSLL